MDTEVRFSGFGGQGVILMGVVLGRAASLHDRPVGADGKEHRKNAIQTQSYGPSARGGHSKCDVKISDRRDALPVRRGPGLPDHHVPAGLREVHRREVKPDTKIIIDPDLVLDRPKGDVYMISATKAAEGLGTRVVANVIMLSAFREISDIVSFEALEKAMLEALPKPTHDLNRSAMALGRKLGQEALQNRVKG